jgi:serine protease Do
MTRGSHPLLWLSTLLLGLIAGLLLGRSGPVLTAQQAPVVAAVAIEGATTPATKAVGESAIYGELERQYVQFEHVNRTFELVARAVAPAVVHIVAKKTGPRTERHASTQYFEETGSGVIVQPEPGKGLFVLTNNHVVEGAITAEIAVTLHDGRVLHPERFWSDRKADIAVLRLSREDLPFARLGDSDAVTVGSWVLAIGSPFGLTHSVSHGIISARNRHEEELEDDGVENQEFLQTDAAINPGNSGGPLVNMKGEIIGINTAIASNGGGSEGVGFSIPVNLARWIMEQLISRGKVSRGALGVNLQDIDAEGATRRGLDRPRGACVLFVRENTPAARAGIHNGDVVIRFNGIEVSNINHLINLVSRAPIGQEVELVLWRDRKSLATRVAIADQDQILAATGPAAPPAAAAPARTTVPQRRPTRPAPPQDARP